MKKMQFKKILNIIDAIELQGITFHDAPQRVYDELIKDSYILKLSEVKEIIAYLCDKKLLIESINGIDLCPAPTVYAKSDQNSGLEALSIFESFIRDEQIFIFYKQQVNDNSYKTKAQISAYIDHQSLQFMMASALFEIMDDTLRFHPRLMKGIHEIMKQYEEYQPLLSAVLAALYTSRIVKHEDMKIDYKNASMPITNYTYKNVILDIIPRHGIPHDRDETKALQSFYKDILFHEFHHACPICGINIPHMLIASHIKPFRDCAHIYEAMDHNNGLLLCRNHDYLFDQGYVTFDDKGYIMISKELLAHKDLKSAYIISKKYCLPSIYMTPERSLFLAYHRLHIFKDNI